MSKLDLFSRPWVVFDPTNKAHRKYYFEFLKHGSWGHCPIRFVLAEDCNNLTAGIQRVLNEYYVNKEFEKETKKR